MLDLAVEAGYTGEAWTELQRRLVERAFPDLERSIATGTIYHRCTRAGVPVRRSEELQRHPYPEDIAAVAVENCLERFRASVVPRGQWDPHQGTTLEDFFCACCLPDVANEWRWHLRRLPDRPVPLDGLDEASEARILSVRVESPADPADAVVTRDLVARALAPLSQDDQKTFVLLTCGWSPREIARMLGITRNALDARISRARKAASTRRAS